MERIGMTLHDNIIYNTQKKNELDLKNDNPFNPWEEMHFLPGFPKNIVFFLWIV